MKCKNCLKTPGYHSFDYITDISGIAYYMCFPAKNKQSVKTQEDMLNFVSHFPKEKKWSLFFVMKGYGFSNMMPISIAWELAKIVFRDYATSLQRIYILEGSWFLRFLFLTFPLFGNDIQEKFVLVEGSPLEVLAQLQKTGISFSKLEPIWKFLT